MQAMPGQRRKRRRIAKNTLHGESSKEFGQESGRRIYNRFHQLIHELELKYPGFNKRRLSYSDFELICRAEDIITWQDKIPWKGWYFLRSHYNFIVIKNSLSKFHKLFTAFHELGHYFAHAGRNHFSRRPQGPKKLEMQADIFAAIALVPTPLLEILESMHYLSAESVAGIFNLPKAFSQFRLKIFKSIHL